jgi:hypothetical protein
MTRSDKIDIQFCAEGQTRNLSLNNLEIPGSMLRIAPE